MSTAEVYLLNAHHNLRFREQDSKWTFADKLDA